MQTISPVAVRAFRAYGVKILGYLDETEYLAHFDAWNEKDIAALREAVRHLVLIIRGMVVAHESDDGGDCRLCETPWPCWVTEYVHGLVRDPDNAFDAILEQVNKKELGDRERIAGLNR
jgi:hypothetical protein